MSMNLSNHELFKHVRALLCTSAVAALAAVPTVAGAAPTVIIGSGFSTGINAGFGDAIGQGSTLAISSSPSGAVNWVLDCGAGNLDNANAVVIYLDTNGSAGGYAGTSTFTDIGADGNDQLRMATSATNGTVRADVTFAPGFTADYALVFNSGFGVLYQLNPTGHNFISVISGAGFGAGGPYNFSHTFADLGLTYGASFNYLATYLDPIGTFRSNEFQGVADSSVPDENIGFGSIALSAGDFNTYISVVPEPAGVAGLGIAGVVLAARRRR